MDSVAKDPGKIEKEKKKNSEENKEFNVNTYRLLQTGKRMHGVSEKIINSDMQTKIN
ncbi:MAG: hypothetical protein CM15mP13_2950 [Pseudomonadota bacterium]|nr:MAG: hypothetical protein CM15mP13_2950 [Pseudomonadota bacterium]